MRKELSVKNRVLISYGLNGLLWLISSMLDIVDLCHQSVLVEIVNSVFLFVALIFSFKVLFNRNQEEDDELSKQEFGNSCVAAFAVMFLIIAVSGAAISVIEIAGADSFLMKTITLKKVFDLMRAFVFGTIGLTELLIGIFFCKQEKDE